MSKHLSSPGLPAVSQDAADAREFDDYARTQEPAELQAALWASRRGEGLDAEAEAQFQAWLAAGPGHRALYEALAGSLDGVRGLPGSAVQSLRAGLADAAAPAPRPGSAARRHWLAGLGRLVPRAALGATVLVAAGGGWMGWEHWRSLPTFEQDYATARGQRLNADLPDGSALQLDAATRVQVRLYRERRDVRLLDGQAMFIVSSRPRQPFEVQAGPVRVAVVGTRFSVRHTQAGIDAGKTVVAVESGRVRVSGTDAPDPQGAPVPVELGAGQAMAADERGHFEPVTRMAPEAVAAWRQGRVSFADTPLAQALAEFERYGDTGLVVSDPAVGALRLGGSFDLRQAGVFAQALPHLLPVRLERRAGVTEIVGLR